MLKRERETYSKFFLILVLLINSFFMISIVSAADVAYIVSNTFHAKPEFINILNELSMDYDLIESNNINNYDLSEYRLMIVNNDYFVNWDEIPVNDFPALIANGRNMENWGWTTRITSSSRDTPMMINLNNSLEIAQGFDETIQVYNHEDPDIYYLDRRDIYDGLIKVGLNLYDNDDAVIALAEAGTLLTKLNYPDTEVHADSCFFGITESRYWTNESKELFKRCVLFAALGCRDDSDCPDEAVGDRYCMYGDVYQDIKEFYCENPGTSESECVDDRLPQLIEECSQGCDDGACIIQTECNDNIDNDQDNLIDEEDSGCWEDISNPLSYNPDLDDESDSTIICSFDSNCGDDGYIGDMYCMSGDVYQDYQEFNCNNPGLGTSSCSDTIEPILIESCADICSVGECVERECSEDLDCEEDYSSENYCEAGNVYYDFHDFSCEQDLCVEDVIEILVDSCEQTEICIEGECRGVECNNNLDCGSNGFSGLEYCFPQEEFGNSYEDFISFMCVNPGTVDSYCTDYTFPILREYCDFKCISGECISCFNEFDCGDDGYIGDRYCMSGDVYQDYQDFGCENPGTSESECSDSLSPILAEACSEDEICMLGECEEIICKEDPDCEDYDEYTYDECNNPGTINSYCSNTPMNCLSNNDCGITGFSGDEFCQNNDVYKYFQESICINSGTTLSYCDVSEGPEFLIDCGDDSCDGRGSNYCEGNDVYRNKVCHQRRCEGGRCITGDILDEELVEVCADICIDGECIERECIENSDCPGDSYSDTFCIGNNVSHTHYYYTCEQESCVIHEENESIGYCEQGCEDGSCIGGSHDVGLIDFTNSIGGIKLKYKNGTDILEETPILECNQKYEIWIDVENQGDYFENITFSGSINGLIVNHISKDNLAPGYNNEKYRTVNMTLVEGFYTINIEAIITGFTDENPLNNIAQRDIEIVCEEGECSEDGDCGSQDSELICVVNDVYNQTTTPICVSGECDEDINEEFVAHCPHGCMNGECLNECSENSDCPEDSYSDNFCIDDDVYNTHYYYLCEQESCVMHEEDELVEVCADICIDGECIEEPPECSDGLDNDGDGLIDALIEVEGDCDGGTPFDQIIFGRGNTHDSQSYFHKLADAAGLITGRNYHFAPEQQTAEKLCALTETHWEDLGLDHSYPKYVSHTLDDFSEPRGDYIYQWSSSQEQWNTFEAEEDMLWKVTCEEQCSPVVVTNCSDGIDNDGDGYIDYPEDEGCNSIYDISEIAHDPGCEDPEDDDERDCLVNSDCEEDYYSNNYCIENDLYQDFHDFFCEDNVCVEDIDNIFIEPCKDKCKDGKCKSCCC